MLINFHDRALKFNTKTDVTDELDYEQMEEDEELEDRNLFSDPESEWAARADSDDEPEADRRNACISSLY
jgi:hypothetical protein